VHVQVYGIIGIFGAARYGLATAGNILVNAWLGFSPVAEGALDWPWAPTSASPSRPSWRALGPDPRAKPCPGRLPLPAYLSISIPPILARPGPCARAPSPALAACLARHVWRVGRRAGRRLACPGCSVRLCRLLVGVPANSAARHAAGRPPQRSRA